MNSRQIKTKKRFTHTHAFTLVELLVVSAVIAILAAVALNQMAGAKIRAEVAKVKTDFKLIASAVQMYQLDYDEVPPAPQNGLSTSLRYVQNMRELTSPTPYLTTLPTSPWSMKNMHVFNMVFGAQRSERTQARTGAIVEEDWEKRPDYQFKEGGYLQPVTVNAEWTLISCGPVRVCSVNPYHPSNGILSIGGVYYTPQTRFVTTILKK